MRTDSLADGNSQEFEKIFIKILIICVESLNKFCVIISSFIPNIEKKKLVSRSKLKFLITHLKGFLWMLYATQHLLFSLVFCILFFFLPIIIFL